MKKSRFTETRIVSILKLADGTWILGEHADVAQPRVGNAHRVRDGRRAEDDRRREHDGRGAPRAEHDLAEHRRRGRRGAFVAAVIAVDRHAGRQEVVLGRRHHGLHVHAGRPDALFGLGEDVEPHDADGEEGHRRHLYRRA